MPDRVAAVSRHRSASAAARPRAAIRRGERHSRLLLPAILNDEIIVTAELERLGGATISFKQTIMRGEAQLIDASTRVACLDSGTLEATCHP